MGLKRAYDKPSLADGARVLVDRLWPRGITKGKARIDEWLKDLAPSTELRRWYHARPTMWDEFRKRYLEELRDDRAAAALEKLYELASSKRKLTLVYSSKNEDRNNAVVLKELLEGMRKPPHTTGSMPAVANRARRAVR